LIAPRASPWVAVLAYAAVIFYLSSQSHPLPWVTHHFWDKGLHCTEYAGLGLLLVVALFRSTALRPAGLVVAATALAVFYGATDEIHQYFVPGRLCEWGDLLADSIGGALGALFGMLLARRFLSPGDGVRAGAAATHERSTSGP
jgi:VanZ family protein